MKRKHIDICNIAYGITWIHTRSVKNFSFLTANNVSFAITENNYYWDRKANKIRYKFQDCTGASYDHLYAVYMEVYPGIFNYCTVSTGESLREVFERYAKIYNDNDYSNNPVINEWRKELVRID